MPIKPTIKPISKEYTSIGMLRSILGDKNNDLIYNEQLAKLLQAEPTTASIRQCGEQILSLQANMNQFTHALVNMIGMQRIQYLLWTNPWSWAKQGKLEMGETIEQIWMGLAEAYPFDPEKAETGFLKRTKPDISAAYYRVNYAVVYEITVDRKRLQRAFTSMSGLVDLVETIIATPGRTASIDEFMIMKYTLAITILNGGMKMITIPAITKNTADDVITTVTTITNDFQFPLPGMEYNRAGVENVVSPADTMILETTQANAYIKVNALAQAYNIDEVKFMGNVVMHDGLGNYNWKRMSQIFADDPSFTVFTQSQINALNSIELIAMDRQFMQIYDNYEYMAEPLRNGKGAFENYFYHVSKVLGTSPFHNAVGFTTMEAGAIALSISPTSAVASPNQPVIFSADIQSGGFNNMEVTWSVTGGNTDPGTAASPKNITWIHNGVLEVGDAEAEDEITVTVTSVADPTKKATATVTVG